MRVLVLVNDFPTEDNSYTANIFVKEQVRALSKLVDDINIVVPIPHGLDRKRGVVYRDYQMENGNVNVHFVRYFNPLFPVTYYKFREQWRWVESRVLKNFINEKGIKFDIIHAHYTWPSGAVAVKLREMFRVPVVITEHTSQTFMRFINTKDKLIISSWKIADAIIRVRRGDINLLTNLGVETPVYFIPNGFYEGKFKPIPTAFARSQLKLPLDKRIVLNVAQMYSDVKGHKILLKAFYKVANSTDDTILVLVGDGKLRPDLEKLASRLGISERVVFAGSKPHDEIPLWMNAADLFVLPSLSEGNPTVMFEALGVGLPFVGTAVGGVPEIITSEDYGLLCPPADPECLAEKILIGLEKEWDREKIRKYAEQFTWENIAKQILRVYENMLSPSRRRVKH
ncbi:glycosyltransferase family 4 protein [Thermococcus zilligii]|uniref:glycosyltransferase family 4 protein n=1 Tax=Thermococcus zilligii TaxID=54076 RepID=UPI00029B4D8B|nr:glycosyltransferase family 4 protein [Thermococcus zilligii]